jgi:hypothetical protein
MVTGTNLKLSPFPIEIYTVRSSVESPLVSHKELLFKAQADVFKGLLQKKKNFNYLCFKVIYYIRPL